MLHVCRSACFRQIAACWTRRLSPAPDVLRMRNVTASVCRPADLLSFVVCRGERLVAFSRRASKTSENIGNAWHLQMKELKTGWWTAYVSFEWIYKLFTRPDSQKTLPAIAHPRPFCFGLKKVLSCSIWHLKIYWCHEVFGYCLYHCSPNNFLRKNV